MSTSTDQQFLIDVVGLSLNLGQFIIAIISLLVVGGMGGFFFLFLNLEIFFFPFFFFFFGGGWGGIVVEKKWKITAQIKNINKQKFINEVKNKLSIIGIFNKVYLNSKEESRALEIPKHTTVVESRNTFEHICSEFYRLFPVECRDISSWYNLAKVAETNEQFPVATSLYLRIFSTIVDVLVASSYYSSNEKVKEFCTILKNNDLKELEILLKPDGRPEAMVKYIPRMENTALLILSVIKV